MKKRSAFYNIFNEKGYKVIRSSIRENQDFFKYEPNIHWDIIITNPPFSKKDMWIKRCFEFNKKFALLLPLNAIQGINRYKYFKYGIEILTFDKRIDYHTNGDFNTYTKGNHFASAYFCKGVLHQKLIIEELKKYKRPLK